MAHPPCWAWAGWGAHPLCWGLILAASTSNFKDKKQQVKQACWLTLYVPQWMLPCVHFITLQHLLIIFYNEAALNTSWVRTYRVGCVVFYQVRRITEWTSLSCASLSINMFSHRSLQPGVPGCRGWGGPHCPPQLRWPSRQQLPYLLVHDWQCRPRQPLCGTHVSGGLGCEWDTSLITVIFIIQGGPLSHVNQRFSRPNHRYNLHHHCGWLYPLLIKGFLFNLF